MARNIPISGPMTLRKARDFVFLLDFLHYCTGNDWLQQFKLQHGVLFKVTVGKAASANDQDVATWLETNREVISSYAECDVYNAGRAALFYQMLQDKTHIMKGDTRNGRKYSKVRITALLCTNIDGSNRLVPFVIGKSKKPHCFRSCVPVSYRHNAKTRMTSSTVAC